MLRAPVLLVVSFWAILSPAVHAGSGETERRPVAVVRARASVPFLVSASFGAVWDRKGYRPDCRLTCDLRGTLVQGEVGWKGAQISVGYAALVADRIWAPWIASDVYTGVAVKGVLVRTWDGVGISPGNQWLLGAEVEGTISRINLSLGLLRTFDTRAKHSWEWIGGVGWGF